MRQNNFAVLMWLIAWKINGFTWKPANENNLRIEQNNKRTKFIHSSWITLSLLCRLAVFVLVAFYFYCLLQQIHHIHGFWMWIYEMRTIICLSTHKTEQQQPTCNPTSRESKIMACNNYCHCHRSAFLKSRFWNSFVFNHTHTHTNSWFWHDVTVQSKWVRGSARESGKNNFQRDSKSLI